MNEEQKIEAFLTHLEDLLQEKGWTIPYFAKQMKVSKVTVYRWLDGNAIMSLKHYYRALEVLGLEENLTVKENNNGI